MILYGYFLNARSTCIVQLNKKLKYMFGSLTFFNFLKYRIECGQGGVSNLVTRVTFFLYKHVSSFIFERRNAKN